MENSKNNDFFNSLNQGFEDFSENPPTRVWEGIEFDLAIKQLEKDKKRFFWMHYSSLFIIAFFISLCIYQLFHYQKKSINRGEIDENRTLKKNEILTKKTNSENNEILKTGQRLDKGSDELTAKKNDFKSSNLKLAIKNLTIKNGSVENIELFYLEKKSVENSQISLDEKEAKNILLSNSEISNEFFFLESFSETIKTINKSVELIENNSSTELGDTNRVEIITEKIDSIQKNNISISTLPKDNIKFGSRFSVGTFFSPDYSNRILSSNNDLKIDKDVEQINNQEKPKFAYSYGLRFGFDLTKKLTINTGFTYSFLRQSYMPTNLDIDTTGDDYTEYSYLSSSGIVEFSSNDFEFIEEDQNSGEDGDSLNLSFLANEKLNFISIPLFIRQQVSSKKTKVFTIYGLTANIVTSKELNIQVLDSPNNARITKKDVNSLKKANFGVSLGMGFERELFKGFSFFVEPTIKCSFTSMNKKDFVKSYPYTFGLSTGISYHF
ncbi:MAG: hypothetical protein EBZ94_01890 [Crocinitomicaceae bacterium]|nr:hypothetical protein [Crocinitomicaceae bacterium]NDA97902.1 hypothetical protein [Flavobacteriia bacterium]NDC28069.1 hypothetical protein [Crocinitomicaceae bacterium]NDC92339.1 hypothetical protein [Flavobacteriales bacterium]